MWINQNSYTKPVKVKNGTNMLEKTWYYLVYLKMHTPFNLITLILDIYLRDTLVHIRPGDMHKNVYTSTLCDSHVL